MGMLGPSTRLEQVGPVADFFGLDDLNVELSDRVRKEEEKSGAMLEGLESSTEGLKDVLHEIQSSIGECADKLEDIKIEMATVGTNLEDLWRIKCEITNMSEALVNKTSN